MKCYHHPETDAATDCKSCFKPICPTCTTTVDNQAICPACVQLGVQYLHRARTPEYKSLNPAAAGWLALLPTLGAIYNGTYLRALYQFLGFALVLLLADASDLEPLGALGFMLFYIYTIFDAYRTAKKMKLGLLTATEAEPVLTDRTRFLKGAALILIGILLILHNFDLISFSFVFRLWPLVFIGLGAYLLYRNYRPEAAQATPGPGSPERSAAAPVPPETPAPEGRS